MIIHDMNNDSNPVDDKLFTDELVFNNRGSKNNKHFNQVLIDNLPSESEYSD